MNECINTLSEAIFVSMQVANSKYWQIEIYNAYKSKMAFKLYCSRLCFFEMPFRHQSAPDTFQETKSVMRYNSSETFLLRITTI